MNTVVAQILPEDRNGGAFRIPEYLHYEFPKYGINSYMVVGEKHTNDERAFEIPNFQSRSKIAKKMIEIERKITPYTSFKGGWRIREIIRFIGQPKRMLKIWAGFEDFEFPGTWKILDILPEKPSVLLCHVLHGFWLQDRGFFDLRALPYLSQKTKVILVQHDMWLFTGHCSFSMGCERWKIGCGKCPDLNLPPRIRRDLSYINWKIKRKIYMKSKFFVVVPSRWIKSQVESSILMEGAKEVKLIYNGIPLDIFTPSDKAKSRKILNLPQDKVIIMTAAKSLKTNLRKGFDIFFRFAKKISQKHKDIIFLGLGGSSSNKVEEENIGENKILYLPFEQNQEKLKYFYSASDFFVLPSRAESLGLVFLEAQGSGTIPCGTNIGGIPEIIEDMKTGILFDLNNVDDLVQKVEKLIENRNLYEKIRENAILNSKKFDIKEKAKEYVDFILSVIER
jgi:glycosyltransferase involved in cell wall biosynthesis